MATKAILPSPLVRLFLWFGILLGGDVLACVFYLKMGGYFLLALPFFPTALFYPFVVMLHTIVPDTVIGYFGQSSFYLSWGFYLANLVFTLKTQSIRTWGILFTALIAAVLLNAVGFHMLLNEGRM